MKDYKAALAKHALVKAKRASIKQQVADALWKPSAIPRPTKNPLAKHKKLTQKEMWAIYGILKPQTPRYTGLKGIYWHVVSEYVRRRDFKMWKGACISCGKRATVWHQFQGGHFIAASTGGFALLFDLHNINAECGYCNGFDENHLIGYERNLDARYGKGSAQLLKERYAKSRWGTPAKAWNDRQYDTAIRQLQGELIHLQ